jgi:UDP-N-acetylmuramoyl-tripeptide--D-alanyl-D-alanine ligase
MGAGKPGDIAYLAAIARPDIGLVTLIAPAHLERMGSIEGVAETKGALYQALPATASPSSMPTMPLPVSSPTWPARAARCCASAWIIRRRRRGHLEQRIDGSRFVLSTPIGDAEVSLPLPGRHNIANALAAAAVALALEVPLDTIVIGLEQVSGVSPAGCGERCAAAGP